MFGGGKSTSALRPNLDGGAGALAHLFVAITVYQIDALRFGLGFYIIAKLGRGYQNGFFHILTTFAAFQLSQKHRRNRLIDLSGAYFLHCTMPT
jgi:hypothetical protein